MVRTLHLPRFRKPRQIAPITISGVLKFIALAYVVAVASYMVLSWGLDNPELMLATERGYFLTDDSRVFIGKPAPD